MQILKKDFSACLIPLLINLLSLCQMKSMSHPNNTSFLLILFIDKTVNVRISIQVYRAAKFLAKERKERNSFPPPISVRRETMQFDRKPATRKNTSWEMIGANHALFSDIYGTPENWGGLEYLLHTDRVNYRVDHMFPPDENYQNLLNECILTKKNLGWNFHMDIC